MAGTVYPAYLLALLVVPLLVKWRWGLAASLAVSAAEVGLVVLLWLLAVPSNPYPIGYPIDPAEPPLLQIRRSQAHGYAMLVTLVMLPAMAAVIGGVLAVASWALPAAWRSAAGWLRPEAR